jgi:hypothetical protein
LIPTTWAPTRLTSSGRDSKQDTQTLNIRLINATVWKSCCNKTVQSQKFVMLKSEVKKSVGKIGAVPIKGKIYRLEVSRNSFRHWHPTFYSTWTRTAANFKQRTL